MSRIRRAARQNKTMLLKTGSYYLIHITVAALVAYAVTGNDADLYRFRTPSLRNVALTAPYGHSGAYATLESVVRHHLDPRAALLAYDPATIALPALDGANAAPPPMPDADEIARIAAAVELAPLTLSDPEIADILAFLSALTDPHATIGRLGAPSQVPSGLPVDRLVSH